jgi:hypothetical protein
MSVLVVTAAEVYVDEREQYCCVREDQYTQPAGALSMKNAS